MFTPLAEHLQAGGADPALSEVALAVTNAVPALALGALGGDPGRVVGT